MVLFSPDSCWTVQVIVLSEPMGVAISAPVTENRMSDLQMSFKVKKIFYIVKLYFLFCEVLILMRIN